MLLVSKNFISNLLDLSCALWEAGGELCERDESVLFGDNGDVMGPHHLAVPPNQLTLSDGTCSKIGTRLSQHCSILSDAPTAHLNKERLLENKKSCCSGGPVSKAGFHCSARAAVTTARRGGPCTSDALCSH